MGQTQIHLICVQNPQSLSVFHTQPKTVFPFSTHIKKACLAWESDVSCVQRNATRQMLNISPATQSPLQSAGYIPKEILAFISTKKHPTHPSHTGIHSHAACFSMNSPKSINGDVRLQCKAVAFERFGVSRPFFFIY